MAVKLRLQRKGRKASPFYHIVVADARSPRDGRFIEKIGTYNPLTVPATIELNRDAAYDWLLKGAQPTDTVRSILRFKGVLLKKHLQQGVKKGALTQEQADARLLKWMDQKEAGIAARREAITEAKRKFVASVDGTAKAKVKPAPPVEEAAPAVEETPAVAEEAVVESVVAETPAVAEEVVAETPAVAEETVEVAETVVEETVVEAAVPVAEAEEVVAETTEEVAAVAEEAAPAAEEAAPAAEEEKSEDA